MARSKYVRETSRGRVLHLLVLPPQHFGNREVYLDASQRITDAEREDHANGYDGVGPLMAHEIEKARDYADYVAQHATIDTLHKFYSKGYSLFADGQSSPKQADNAVA